MKIEMKGGNVIDLGANPSRQDMELAAAFLRMMQQVEQPVAPPELFVPMPPPSGLVSDGPPIRWRTPKRAGTHTRRKGRAEEENPPPVLPFEPSSATEIHCSAAIKKLLSNGGWFVWGDIRNTAGILAQDTAAYATLRKTLSKLVASYEVVARRTGRQVRGASLVYASAEEDATKSHDGMRTWSVR